MHENDNTLHTSISRVSPTRLPYKMAMVCMLGILEKQNKTKQNKTKDHSPSMTLSKGCLKQNDLGPLSMLRYLAPFLSWSYDDPRPSRLTSKDRVVYQKNGKTTMSKGLKIYRKDI